MFFQYFSVFYSFLRSSHHISPLQSVFIHKKYLPQTIRPPILCTFLHAPLLFTDVLSQGNFLFSIYHNTSSLHIFQLYQKNPFRFVSISKTSICKYSFSDSNGFSFSLSSVLLLGPKFKHYQQCLPFPRK
jgi:hypothetical protein